MDFKVANDAWLVSPRASISSFRSSLLREQDNSLGLKILAEGIESTVDVIAVHGLNGHRERTWTASNGVLWLRDFLPAVAPHARVITYGYDARTRGSSHASNRYIYDYAIEFVGKLCALRRDTSTEHRSIIFLAHSLGGVLVKSALVHSAFSGPSHLEEHRSIKTSTYGVLFFGTPHSGSDSATWATLLLNIISAFAKTNTLVVKRLKTNSEWLRQQTAQFTAIGSSFDIKCCYEALQTTLPLGKGVMVVPPASAIMQDAPNVEALRLSKNHVDLVRFSSDHEDDFVSIASCLRIMLRKCEAKVAANWRTESIIALTIDAQTQISKHNVVSQANGALSFEVPFRPPIERAPNFVGRKAHSQQIHDYLCPASGSADFMLRGVGRVLVLSGLGGVGKTQLTFEYAIEHQDQYSAVLWVNGSSIKSAQRGFRRIAQSFVDVYYTTDCTSCLGVWTPHLGKLLGPNGQITPDEASLERITSSVMSFLERKDNDNWLLILDSVDNLQEFPIQDFLPKTPSRKVIVTTRLAAVRLGYTIRVGGMDEEEAVQLLLASGNRRTKTALDIEHAKSIAKKLGYLPLALDQAGAYVSDVELPFGEYIPLFEENRPKLLRYEPTSGWCTPRGETVLTTWEISFKGIESYDGHAAELMLLLAFMHHETCWEGLFHLAYPKGLVTSEQEESDFHWLPELCADKYRFKNAFGKILSVSLVQRGTLPGSLYLHPLVHAWGRDRLPPSKRYRKLLHALTVIGSALRTISGSPTTKDALLLKQKILVHADACLEIAKSEISDSRSLSAEKVTIPALYQIAVLYKELGRLPQAEAILRLVLEFIRETAASPPIYEVQVQLAEVLYWSGICGEAENHYRDSIATQKSLFGDRHPGVFAAQVGLGKVLWETGRLGEADELLDSVLQNIKGTGGLGAIGQQAASNLGMVHWHQGRLKDAERCHKLVLEDLEASPNQEHMADLEPRYRLAIVYMEGGQWDNAEKEFTKVYLDRLEYLGIENPETLRSANALGNLYLLQGRYDESRPLLEAAWDGQLKLQLGAGNPSVLRTANNIGMLNRCQGKYPEAFEWLERGYSESKKAFGDTHYSFISCSTELAVLHVETGQPQQALALLDGMKCIPREERDPRRPVAIRALKVRGDALLELGRLEEANRQYSSLLPLMHSLFGEDHPYTLNLQLSMARLSHRAGRYGEARSALCDVVSRLKRSVGEGHPMTLEAVELLGDIRDVFDR
ncbi:hypothetical protein GP486_001902 [Trichoglossum hirsutum]|uniref:NB-ARC domain-containing protein n=1 Tax=Trichoglossum hirsutum TaxID=265104 RepID=A0A9P8LFT3_9PEZI|nr:hypothetical protein GP486_001902 [Trichoglossum hirsutum]